VGELITRLKHGMLSYIGVGVKTAQAHKQVVACEETEVLSIQSISKKVYLTKKTSPHDMFLHLKSIVSMSVVLESILAASTSTGP
jgi:hypothetical protein